MKYLKKFENHSQYENYISGGGVALPNVSLCEQENEVHYNPYEGPKNILNYKANYKINEITYAGDDCGLYVNGFGGSSGQQLTITSHTFENGVGTIEFDDDVIIIGNWAFSCSNLLSIDIPNHVTSIGENAFSNCTSLTSVTIGNGVTSIDFNTFSGCTSLTSINIPNSVTAIYGSAFYGCTSLTSVTIGSGVTSIGDGAFDNCSNLSSIIIDNGNTVYDSRNNCNAIIETSTNTLIQGCKNTIIPNTVTSIGNSAFDRCSGLTSIDIPNSVTSIGEYAFGYCRGLTSIIIGSGVTSISTRAFTQCNNLTSITIPSGITNIGGYAFQGCSKLASITCNATTAPTITSNTFNNVKTGGTLYVPQGSTGYDTWMGTGDYYLGKYGWTKVEQ